jgi:hypothetical protein
MKKALLATLCLGVATPVAATAPPAHAASDRPAPATATVPPAQQPGGRIDPHFVGLSIEWSLVERYMGDSARPAFANLLRNLDGGILRIGGSSQDQTPFSATAPNANDVITPEDIADVRATLDATRTVDRTGWATVLGTAMAPVSTKYPFRSPEHTRAFVEQGVRPVFSGADDEVAGIELGNEPDLGYHYDVERYLADFARWRDAGGTTPYTTIVPATSNAISPWQSIRDESVQTRFFHDWPQILATTAPTQRATSGPLGAWTADHFYPLARTCTSDPYRCPSIPALLEPERRDNLDYIAYHHAELSKAHGLKYRLEEINTAAGRGADGVSNVAASAIWALDTMFHVACPNPPDQPGANDDCRTGGVGVNFHNAEVRAFYAPEEGNGYYNAIRYDESPAMGSPTPAPEYYAMLLFSAFAQGHDGLRPVPVNGADDVAGWRVNAAPGESTVFLVNRSEQGRDVKVTAPGVRYLLDRMTPFDPSGEGRTLAAPEVRIDGRAVAADGTWPGFAPQSRAVHDGRVDVHLGAGEAVVLRVRPS